MNNNSTVIADSNLKNAYQSQMYEERQVNFICEAFRTAVEVKANTDMVPLVIYQPNHKVPNGGLEDIIEVHGMFNEITAQTAIFRLSDDLEKWCMEQLLPANETNPHIVTELVKNDTGEITMVRFKKRKVFPMWSPHRRRFS